MLKANITKNENLKAPLLILITMSAAALFFVFFDIDHTFGLDEAASVAVASSSLIEIPAQTVYQVGNPPLYYFLLHGWMKLFGMSETATRSLSGLIYLLTLPAVYFLGKRLHDQKTGLLAALLFLVSPVALRPAQNARMYSLMGLCAALSLLYFFKLYCQKSGSKADAAKYIAANITGMYTHYWFFFIFAAQVLGYFFFLRGTSFKKFAAAVTLSFFPFLFWVPGLMEQIRITPGAFWWVPKADLGLLINTGSDFLGGGKAGLLVWAAVLGLVWFGRQELKTRLHSLKDFFVQKSNQLLLFLTVVSLLIPWTISQFKPIFAWSKYAVIALPPLAVLLGALLSRFARPIFLFVFCLFLLGGSTAGYVYKKTRPRIPSDKSTAEFLIRTASKGDVLLFAGSSRATLEYYLRLRQADQKFVKISFPIEMGRHPFWSDPDAMLARKPELEKEADSLADFVQTLLNQPAAKIWLIYGYYPEIEKIVKDEFDRRFKVTEEIILKNPYWTFYDRIRVYQNRSIGDTSF